MIKKRASKRANILIQNITFIILNLIFLSILILFLFSRTGSAAVLEEEYSKQIALIIDSAKPVMEIHLNMEKAKKLAEKNGLNFGEKGEVVRIEDNLNIVTVRLSEKGGYSYSFFNDVDVDAYPKNEFYVFTINEKEK